MASLPTIKNSYRYIHEIVCIQGGKKAVNFIPVRSQQTHTYLGPLFSYSTHFPPICSLLRPSHVLNHNFKRLEYMDYELSLLWCLWITQNCKEYGKTKASDWKSSLQTPLFRWDSSIPVGVWHTSRVITVCASTSYACPSICEAANIQGLHWFLWQMRSLTRFCLKEVVPKSHC